jgi:hypothetical protein
VTDPDVDAEHVLASVTVTVYVVVVVGDTVMDAVPAVVLHEYPVPPLAVSVLLPPTHIAAGAAVIDGAGSVLTVTVLDAVAEQALASVTTTEYVVVVVGDTVVAAVMSVLLHT